MTELKHTAIPDDKPVKITVELPAEVFRDLQAYAVIVAKRLGKLLRPIRPSSLRRCSSGSWRPIRGLGRLRRAGRIGRIG